ncbi:MAG: hypothetical protein ACI36W_03215 [Coriobacteriales bacterium]
MLETKNLHKLKVYVSTKKGKVKKYGKVHCLVFHPSKPKAVGLMVKRPDAAMMVQRKDRFVSLDKVGFTDEGDILVELEDRDAWDRDAAKRLAVDLDLCIIWDGMPVRNLQGLELGIISNIVLGNDLRIQSIDISSGDVNRLILGSADISIDKLRGYDPNQQAIIADVQPADIEVSGGVAAKAGEAWAKGTHKVSQGQEAVSARAAENIEDTAYAAGEAIGSIKEKASAKAEELHLKEKGSELSSKAGEAINTGAYKLGQAIGSLRDKGGEDEPSVPSAAAGDAAAGGSKPASENEEDSVVDSAARALGSQLRKTKGMFSAFKEEFDKASK